MRKDSGQAVLNSTMAELAFMLVFVFAIFAAVGNAHEPDTPNAAARVLAEEKENVSCLYVPWDPQGEGRFQSGKFVARLEVLQWRTRVSAAQFFNPFCPFRWLSATL